MARLVAKNPAERYGLLNKGDIAVGYDADLVLLDISLPDMDGTGVLSWIRGQEALRDLPVVALTAHAMAGDRERFLAQGFDDYLPKPIVDERVFDNPG